MTIAQHAAQPRSLLFPILLVIYEIATYLSNDMYLPAIPQMMSELGLTMNEAQLTLTTWFLGQASMPLIAGMIADRYGRRPVLLWGGVLYVLATLLCAITSNIKWLLIGRMIEGAMVATMLVSGYACIHELYEHKQAIRILALMGSITILAPALGPLFGSVVLYFSSWRGIFGVIAVWALIAIICLYKWMPETHPKENRHTIYVKLLLQQYFRVLTNWNFIQLMGVLGLIFAGWIAWITASPLLVMESYHYNAMWFGLIQAFIFAAYIIGNYHVKYLLEILEIRYLILLGISITLIGSILTLICSYFFSSLFYLFLCAMLLYSYGSALCFSPLNRTIIESSNEPMGIRVALFTVFFTGFAAIGSAAASLFFDGTSKSLGRLLAFAMALASILLIVNLIRTSKE